MTLQEQLALLRAGNTPLPLVGVQAVTQAIRLRKAGMTYGAIAIAMREYHGCSFSENGWRSKLRARGVPPKHYADGSLRVPPQLQGSRDVG